jgi:flavin-dependent dehydrogenase
MTRHVVVVGAGPAGLAAAIQLVGRGLAVTVLERAAAPPDKACGEGLVPSGVAELESMGARSLLGPADCHPLEGVRYIQEDGSRATGRFPAPGGLGIRRSALTRVLADTAERAGARIIWDCRLKDHDCGRENVRLETGAGPLEADLLVAADGLHSAVRRRAGLMPTPGDGRRFGVRRHFHRVPDSSFVEVHLARGREAFVTPVGPDLVGVAFLWDRSLRNPRGDSVSVFDRLLEGFPDLAERFAGAPPASRVQGAGPLAQRPSATVARRLVLIGDAAGYVDAITGEGLSLAFAGAAALAATVPGALERGATREALAPYARAHARLFRRYALVTGAVLGIARRPRLRRPLIRWLGKRSGVLDRLVAWGLR